MTHDSSELLDPGEWKTLAFLFVLALALHAIVSIATARAAGVPLSHLAMFYDGHLYLEIAKSFPLPYSPEGHDYWGQPPGLPALIYIARVLVPDAWADWGLVALLTAWIFASAAPVAFYLLCKQVGSAPFWPSVLFIVANPRWVMTGSLVFSEGPALLLAILGLLAHLRRRPAWCAAFLSAAVMTRYPSLLLGAPIAFGVLWVQRDLRIRALALLAVPLFALAALHGYLAFRIPDFPGVWAVHQIFWNTHLTWPFASFWLGWEKAWLPGVFELTFASLAFYLAAIVIGLRPRERHLRVFPVWIAVVVLFHVSLAGWIGAVAFTRLVILAWPVALLVVWRLAEPRWRARGAVAALAAAAALVSGWYAHAQIARVVSLQPLMQPFLAGTAQRLASDEPHWIDFTRIVDERLKARE